MEHFSADRKQMWAVDGNLTLYLEWPYWGSTPPELVGFLQFTGYKIDAKNMNNAITNNTN